MSVGFAGWASADMGPYGEHEVFLLIYECRQNYRPSIRSVAYWECLEWKPAENNGKSEEIAGSLIDFARQSIDILQSAQRELPF